jgi:hypothetical protein
MSEPTATGRLRIVRPPVRRSPDADRPFEVVVDDAVVGMLAHGADQAVELPVGRHRVQLRLDDGASPVREVEIEPGAEVVLGCRSRAGGVNAILRAVARDRYIAWI